MTALATGRTSADGHARDLARPTREPLDRLFRDLRTGPEGLGTREADRRLGVDGPNALPHRSERSWPADVARQITHPLALLLWAASRYGVTTRKTTASARKIGVTGSHQFRGYRRANAITTATCSITKTTWLPS